MALPVPLPAPEIRDRAGACFPPAGSYVLSAGPEPRWHSGVLLAGTPAPSSLPEGAPSLDPEAVGGRQRIPPTPTALCFYSETLKTYRKMEKM